MSLTIGDSAPNFTAQTTEGEIDFHDWIGDGWAVLFSRPSARRRRTRRCDSLQLTAEHQLTTPAQWQPGEKAIIAGSVTDEQAKERYPGGWEQPLPYMRVVDAP